MDEDPARRSPGGCRHAAMLHLEAANPGCDPVLARENAADMERLGAELVARGDRLTALLSAGEAELIGEEMATMRALALTARLLAAELGVWIDTALVGQSPSSAAQQPSFDAALQARIVDRSSELFFCFSELLDAHKTAERRLGIPAPPDPPATGAGAGDE
jgi:hypothetical protein